MVPLNKIIMKKYLFLLSIQKNIDSFVNKCLNNLKQKNKNTSYTKKVQSSQGFIVL